MNPRLVALAGPLKGVIFRLTEAVTEVGREPFNHLCLSDLSVSRRHCAITRADGAFTVKDHASRNGTFVNGVPVNTRGLTHGDQLKLGDHHFLFLLEEEAAPPAGHVQFDSLGGGLQTTVLLPPAEALYQQPEKLLAELPAAARLARELGALLKISASVNALRDEAELAQRLLELSFEAIPADAGAVLLCDAPGLEVGATYSRWRTGAPQPVTLSRTVVQQVLREGVALLSSNPGAHETLRAAHSLHAGQIHALLAVPLLVFEQVGGLLYFVTHDPAHSFDEAHLRLLTAIAGSAAVALANARHAAQLAGENRRLQAELNLQHSLIGESAALDKVLKFIAKVAPSDATVLIRGESGTGKELAARALHQNSPRAAGPFVALNCAALADTLLESELFGHEKGAFTGAAAQKKGKLETAHGGTLFLDELGEMSLPLQAKLLRVLQEREFERVGGTRPIHIDVRLLAATHRDLESAVKSGAFRADLYYRLNVVALTMPALRERRDDIPLLASYFAVKYGARCKRPLRGLTPTARAALQRYDWPGNVRELENAIERAAVLGATEWIELDDLPETILEAAPTGTGEVRYLETLKETKRRLVQEALAQAQGNYAEAARLLGMHVNNLHRLLKNLDLKPGAQS